jgi:hypothetical protein
MFDLFLSGATRAASLMHQCPDSREAFGHLRAMRAANAKACLREWRHMRSLGA